jgi:hypothetical protein
MVAGNWLNNDGLNLNYGTTKALPEIAGDFMTYGDNREIEIYLNLAAQTQNGSPGLLQYSTLNFGSSTTTLAAAGVISDTLIFPLNNATTSLYGAGTSPTYPIIYLEQIEVIVLQAAVPSGATGINLGLVTAQTGQTTANAPPTWLIQVLPNAGTQLLSNLTQTNIATVGQKIILTPLVADSIPVASAVGQGSWLALGNMPLTTTLSSVGGPLAGSAWLSAGAIGGTYTSGLLKIRIKYCIYGVINDAVSF